MSQTGDTGWYCRGLASAAIFPSQIPDVTVGSELTWEQLQGP